jgi:hypothetical protein
MWEFIHKAGGYSAVGIAVAAIFTGLRVLSPRAPYVLTILYAIFVGILGASFIGLEVVRFRHTSKQGSGTIAATSSTRELTATSPKEVTETV